jgi:hypothetical protein
VTELERMEFGELAWWLKAVEDFHRASEKAANGGK